MVRARPRCGLPARGCSRCRTSKWRRWSRITRFRCSPDRSPACSAWSAPAAPRHSRSSPACSSATSFTAARSSCMTSRCATAFPGGRFFLSRREADKIGSSWVEKLRVRSTGNAMKVVELSGGNQQKVVIAKSLVQDPDLIIFDEPTRGVDVGAIVEIHELIQRLADEGKAVVVISSYLPEIMALSDRILVSRGGKGGEEFSALEATEEKIMYAAVH